MGNSLLVLLFIWLNIENMIHLINEPPLFWVLSVLFMLTVHFMEVTKILDKTKKYTAAEHIKFWLNMYLHMNIKRLLTLAQPFFQSLPDLNTDSEVKIDGWFIHDMNTQTIFLHRFSRFTLITYLGIQMANFAEKVSIPVYCYMLLVDCNAFRHL